MNHRKFISEKQYILDFILTSKLLEDPVGPAIDRTRILDHVDSAEHCLVAIELSQEPKDKDCTYLFQK